MLRKIDSGLYVQWPEFEPGWGVFVSAVWDDDDGREFVSDIDTVVVELSEGNARWVGGELCVLAWPNFYVPIRNFQKLDNLWEDDTHDLRTRWFATEADARDHAAFAEQCWRSPEPWRSFVKVT